MSGVGRRRSWSSPLTLGPKGSCPSKLAFSTTPRRLMASLPVLSPPPCFIFTNPPVEQNGKPIKLLELSQRMWPDGSSLKCQEWWLTFCCQWMTSFSTLAIGPMETFDSTMCPILQLRVLLDKFGSAAPLSKEDQSLLLERTRYTFPPIFSTLFFTDMTLTFPAPTWAANCKGKDNHGRATDASVESGWEATLCHDLPLLSMGCPVLSQFDQVSSLLRSSVLFQGQNYRIIFFVKISELDPSSSKLTSTRIAVG